MTKYAIILGGGSGTRFGSKVPKQFLPLGGKPVLMRSINKFVETDASIRIIVVLPTIQVAYWKELCEEYGYNVAHSVVTGGSSRFESVKNALATIEAQPGDVIAIHDGVRPLVPVSVIEASYEVASQAKAAVPVVKVTDSIRMLTDEGESHPVDREVLRAVQTPQTFDAQVLMSAYNTEYVPEFTDDASVVEHAGGHITLIDGANENIKITHSSDLIMAEELLKHDGRFK